MCNKSVKFGGFYDWAMAQGADFVATGHYARVATSKGEAPDTSSGRLPGEPSGRVLGMGNRGIAGRKNVSGAEAYYLVAGADKNKDQSYFLWNIRTEQLPHILFPIGG